MRYVRESISSDRLPRVGEQYCYQSKKWATSDACRVEMQHLAAEGAVTIEVVGDRH